MPRLRALPLALALIGCHTPAQDGSTDSTSSTTSTTSTTPTTSTTAPDSSTATAPTEPTDTDPTDSTGGDAPCVAPALRERSLPALGDVRGVHFVDLDGDGDDELLALVPGTLTAVLDDDSVVVTPLPCSIYDPGSVIPLHLDAGPTMDILAARDGECISVGLGVGDGSFTWVDVVEADFPEPADLPWLTHGVAIDPDGDGIDAVVALENTQVGLYSHFLPDLTQPEWAPIADIAGPLEIAVGPLAGSPAPDLLLARSGCEAVIHPGPDFAAGPTLEGDGQPSESCTWLLGDFGGATRQPVTINRDSGVIEYWAGDPLASTSVDFTGRLDRGTLLRSALPDDPYLLVAHDDDGTLLMRLLWRWATFPAGCTASLAIPYGVLSAGDLDGDGIDELAVVDESPGPPGLRLFALDSP